MDALSCLTQDEAVSPAAFERMAKHLCGFLASKDVQVASVVAKLCVRISIAKEPEVWRNLAKCLDMFTCVCE